LITFITHVILRFLSGCTNASFYHRSKLLGFIATIILIIALGVLTYFAPSFLAQTAFGLSSLCAIGKYRAFNNIKTFGFGDIHLWETLTTLFIPIGLCFSGELSMIALSLYPGLFLHKAIINIGSDLRILDDRTNDVTGKTFDLNFPKWFPVQTINVPRTTQKLRLAVSILCILLAIGLSFFHLPSILGFKL